MKQRPRIYYTESQKALMWERWKQCDSLQMIAQLFDRNHSSIQGILAETGGIRSAQRCRSRLALTLAEREEIFRAVVAGKSILRLSDVPFWTDLACGFNRSSDCPPRFEAISQWVRAHRVSLSEPVHLVLAQALPFRELGLYSQHRPGPPLRNCVQQPPSLLPAHFGTLAMSRLHESAARRHLLDDLSQRCIAPRQGARACRVHVQASSPAACGRPVPPEKSG